MAQRTDLSGLVPALGLGSHEHVALVGGGGKTTLLHALGRSLAGTRVLTATTKMGAWQHDTLPVLRAPTDEEVSAAVPNGPVMVWAAARGDKAIGVSPERCDQLFELVDHVIVEADGSRKMPFKAPKPFEPVVPSSTTMMVSVIGARALGKVIADACHRPLRVAALASCGPYQRLTPAAAASVLIHPDGLRRAVPCGARFAIAITQLDDARPEHIDELVECLEHSAFGGAVLLVRDERRDERAAPRSVD